MSADHSDGAVHIAPGSRAPGCEDAGEHPYFCTVHPQMEGAAMVEDAAGGGIREMPVAKTIRLSLVSATFDGMGGLWALDVATAVEVFDMYGGTYAVVAAWNDGWVQVINRPYAYSNQ